MRSIETPFLFAVTNYGSERALKSEVAAMNLPWVPSFQRKGFVTFKSSSENPLTLDSLTALVGLSRRLCLSLGKCGSEAEALKLLRDFTGKSQMVTHRAKADGSGIWAVIDDSMNYEKAKPGVLIATIIEMGENEFWAGIHRNDPLLSPFPVGDSQLKLPENAPSRAWFKLEEAVKFFRLQFAKEDIVAELGCAPGGVVLALLNCGASVIGVDPAKMAPLLDPFTVGTREQITGMNPLLYHCKKPAALTGKKDLGRGVTWFMSDMNQSPETVLKELERFHAMSHGSIRGVLITLKLTDLTEVARKADWIALLKTMGFTTIKLQQFSVHHRELALLALK